jgi:hypothetical protein
MKGPALVSLKLAALVAVVALLGAQHASAKPPPQAARGTAHPGAGHHGGRPAPPLAMLPNVARVRIEAARDRVVVTQEVNLPRGDWKAGDIDLYAAFGAPGTPDAFDARIVAVPDGATESRPEDTGDAVPSERAPRRPVSAQLLLGRAQMAGMIIHVKDAALRRAIAPGGLAALRLRSLLSPPSEDAKGMRELVVRLGIATGTPLTLGKIQIVSLEPRPWIARAEAQLCGPEADGWPLDIAVTPKPTNDVPASKGPIAPSMAVRHANDDLCVRWWTVK